MHKELQLASLESLTRLAVGFGRESRPTGPSWSGFTPGFHVWSAKSNGSPAFCHKQKLSVLPNLDLFLRIKKPQRHVSPVVAHAITSHSLPIYAYEVSCRIRAVRVALRLALRLIRRCKRFTPCLLTAGSHTGLPISGWFPRFPVSSGKLSDCSKA